MNFNFLKNQTAGNVYFTLLFFALIFYYGLNDIMFQPPQSVHVWRQTNSVSLAQNYYEYNYPFLEPQMHNQFCDNGYSGRSVGEFPIIYYFVAQLWKIFGYDIGIFRIVQLFILFLGLFALFHSLNYIVKNRFWAGFTSLLLFTSPMVVFYGPNFLPDVPGLSFVFMAWFFILKYHKKRKDIFLWAAAALFCMAMLLKITSGLSYITFGGWILFELIFQEENKRIFNFRFKQMLPFILVVIPVTLWYWYVFYYNRIHGGHFSYNGIWPIWQMSKEQFTRIVDALNQIYSKELFFPYTQYFTMAIWLFLVIDIKKLAPVYRFFLIVLTVGFVVQLMLWFQVLEGHDYYMINLLFVFVAVWTILFIRIKESRIFKHYIFYFLGAAIFVLNAMTCRHRIEDRHNGWMNDMYKVQMKALTKIEPYFQQLGIGKEDKVISLPDFTINGSLTYMGRKGYTEFGNDFTKAESFYARINNDAKYLIINDSTVVKNEVFQPFITKKIGQFENISIYDIRGIKELSQ